MRVIHSDLRDRLRYIMNPGKTEDGSLVMGINTTPETAYDDMMETKRRYGKVDKRRGYHIIQSFKPGEIEADDALRFGMEFIEKYLENRYEGVVAVHTDKEHVHVHMIFNSVSFVDGKKYHAAKGEYLERIREMCDEQCRAWGLSVIEGDYRKRKTTKDEVRRTRQGKLTCRDQIRADIDRAIEESLEWEHVIYALRLQGYTIKETEKTISLKAPGMQRFIRLKPLGEGYRKRGIQLRLFDNVRYRKPVMPPKKVMLPEPEELDRYVGIQAQYYNVNWQMRQFANKRHLRYSPALRAEIRKMEQYQEDSSFLERHEITSVEELRELREQKQAVIAALVEQRKEIYRERCTVAVKNDPQKIMELDAKLAEYRSCLAGLRREVRIVDRIEERVLNKIEPMLAAEEAQREIRQKLREEKEERMQKQTIKERRIR